MNQPMTNEERRAYNQRRHAERRQELAARRGAQGRAEVWWDEARRIARSQGDEAWNDLALTLSNYCSRYGG